MRVSMNELRHRISILRPVTETDDEGNILSSSVQEVGKVWALVLPFAAKISDGYAEKGRRWITALSSATARMCA